MTKRTLFSFLSSLCYCLVASAQSPYRLLPIHTNLNPMVRQSSAEEVRGWLGVNQVSTIPTNSVVVDTFSGLPLITVTGGNPAVAITKGFYAAGDRGGAMYVWRSTSPTGQTNIFTIAATGGGYWVESDYLYNLRMNVLRAGAKSDPQSFNNTPVFQSVLDAAAQQKTGDGLTYVGDEPVIYIPSGYYRFDGPLYYIAPDRGDADIKIEGDGQKNTVLAHYFSQGALLNLGNLKFSLSKLKIYNPFAPVEYGRDGIYTLNCEIGNVYDVGFTRLARAIILQNGAMNWNIFSGLHFEGCIIDFLSINAQGTTVMGAHTTGGKFIWYGNVNGVHWVGSAENKVGNTFAPATLLIPAGKHSDFDVAYTEGNKWVAILGHNVTNRATASIQGSDIKLTFEEQHPFYAGNSAVIVAEQTVPQDIQDYLVGTRTLHTASMTNNYALLTPGGTITSDLSPYTFLVIKDLTNTAGVINTRIRSSFAGAFYTQEPTAQYFAAVGNVNDIVLEGEGAESTMITTNTGNLIINGKAFEKTPVVFPIDQYDRNKMLVPENIFPDPTFDTGLEWISGASYIVSNGALVPTNYYGQPALLFYQTARAVSVYPQVHHDFQPIRPMDTLVGKRIAVAAEVIELNHPIFVPTAWTINTPGTGYSDGQATIEHLGRTIQVTLTTEPGTGAITGIAWYYGAFATNVIEGPLTVVQSGGTGGAVTPTAFDNRSYANKRYNGRTLSVQIRKAGDNLNQPAIASVGANLMMQDPFTGHYKGFYVGTLSQPMASMPGLRVSIYSSQLTPGVATGCEAYLITRLYVLTDPFYIHNLDHTLFINRVKQWANTLSEYSNASRFGASWPGAAEVNISRLFAGQEGGVTTLRIQRDNDTIATIPGFRGVTTTTPANPIPGDSFLSNNVYYIYSGTQWVPLN